MCASVVCVCLNVNHMWKNIKSNGIDIIKPSHSWFGLDVACVNEIELKNFGKIFRKRNDNDINSYQRIKYHKQKMTNAIILFLLFLMCTRLNCSKYSGSDNRKHNEKFIWKRNKKINNFKKGMWCVVASINLILGLE